MGLVLGFIGAWLGSSGVFGFGSAWGWFIGSTIGSLLSLENSHETVSSGRITDFKSYNSKYGIPINRGYGTVRLAGNLIWRSPVIEIKVTNTRCIRTGGFFGLGSSKTCISQVTYEYAQSAAIAFAEGPAFSIQKIWADGEVVYRNDMDFLEEPRSIVQHQRAKYNPYNPYDNSPIRIYLGTLTQKVDPMIKRWLGPDKSESGLDEAYAFRSTVYIVIDSIDLEVYGYRMPTFTAEVCFNGHKETVYKRLERPTISPTRGNTMIGQVMGHPHLVAATSSNYRRAIWDITTQELLFEGGWYGSDFSSSRGIQMLSPDFFGMHHWWDTRNSHITTTYHWLRGYAVPSLPDWFYVGCLGVGMSLWDPIRNALYISSNLSAEYQSEKLVRWDPDAGPGTVRTTYEIGVTYPAFTPSKNNDVIVPEAEDSNVVFERQKLSDKFSGLPGGLSGRTRNMHLMRDGGFVGLVSSSSLDDCWLLIAGGKDPELFPKITGNYKLRYADGTLVRDVENLGYVADDDSVIVTTNFGSLATPPQPDGIFKIYLADIDTDLATIYLPDPDTKPDQYAYIHQIGNGDNGGFQRGDLGAGIFAVRTHRDGDWNFDPFAYTFFDAVHMETVRHETFTGSGASNIVFDCTTTLYYPKYNAALGRGDYVAFFGTEPDDVLLSEIVEDLMTRVNGDDLLRLTSSDIDVSELTDLVKGFSLTNQQTIRSAVSQLMQGFFFDAVESDGKIKFKKRGRTSSFSLPEDDLGATNYGTVKGVADNLSYERRTDYELPRELVVRYPDIENDYLQNSQRARKTEGEANSNIDIAFQIVFDKDKAAQVADILLYDAWQEKMGEFSFKVSAKHILIEPSDVGTITMSDGTTHRVRVVSATVGADNTVEITAVNEFENSYVSSAAGSISLIERNRVVNRYVLPVMQDITTRVLDKPLNYEPAVVGGITTMGSSFNGGKFYVSNKYDIYNFVGARGKDRPVTWGIVDSEIGHLNSFLDTDEFDTETVISVQILAGDHPVSGTTAEALAGERLMIVGNEIIGYTNVVSPQDNTVTGTDISFDAATDTINSTTSDFVAAGFTAGMRLKVTEGSPEANYFTWEIDSVSANQISIDGNMTTTQAAGTTVTIVEYGRTCVISNLLRGLYGTQKFKYHGPNAQVYFPENMFPVPVDPPPLGDPVMAYAQAMFGGPKQYTTIAWQANNLMPWNPTNVRYSSGSIVWDRMDRIYSDGIDPVVPTELGESEELYVIRHIDHNTAGSEGTHLKEVETNTASTSAISVPSLPILVDVHQVNQYGFSHAAREVVSSTDTYSGGGEITVATGTPRWNAPVGSNVMVVIGDGPFVGESMLQCSGSEMCGVEMFTGACKDIEVLASVLPSSNTRFTFGQQCGIYLRGTGADTPGSSTSFFSLGVSGAFIGFGGPSADNFSIDIYRNGSRSGDGIIPVYDSSMDYDWDEPPGETYSYFRKFWIRARYYGNRIQSKVWEYGETEPANWQLEVYDQNFGPYFGSCGLFRYDGNIYCDYFSWSHKGGSAP